MSFFQNGEFACLDCNKQFKLKSSLERHRRVIHAEGDTYSCPECNARCPDKGTLARHMYTHTGIEARVRINSCVLDDILSFVNHSCALQV